MTRRYPYPERETSGDIPQEVREKAYLFVACLFLAPCFAALAWLLHEMGVIG